MKAKEFVIVEESDVAWMLREMDKWSGAGWDLMAFAVKGEDYVALFARDAKNS